MNMRLPFSDSLLCLSQVTLVTGCTFGSSSAPQSCFCYVANLIFQLLKPISDLISGTGIGIDTICSRIGSGIDASIDGVTAGFTGLLSTVIPPMVGFKCFLVNCDLAMPYLPNEESKVLFFHTTNLTARLKHEAWEILNLNGHIQSLSEGAMLEGISENFAIFSDLSRKTVFNSHLPLSLRLAISDQFASLANLSCLLECAFIALKRAGHKTKVTFLRELEKAVDEAMNITSLLNGKLDNFDQFCEIRAILLKKIRQVQWFLTFMGFLKDLQENQDRMMFLTFNIHEAQDQFMDVRTSCTNIYEASEELKEELKDISSLNVPDKEDSVGIVIPSKY
ncbi:hypothetical protein DFS33DRAFT_1445259 [Desarmillaria ectypa]|nr:hypothetical protein DFS33DRAFT_1445259 [Desarmillaria ectypa]